MPGNLKWGVLSTAKIGLKAVIPAIERSRNGEVTALASRNLDQAQETARELGIPHAFGSYQELLESRVVDAVYIPLPNNLHREWTVRAAEQGKHILCEKPFALNAAEVDEMIDAARRNHVLLMEAFMYRFHPQFGKLTALIESGTIGTVKVIRSAFGFRLTDPNNIRLKVELGGGSLMDVGCYCVNMSRLVARGEPVEVLASGVFGPSGVDETVVGILRFPENVVAHFDCSFRTDYREWIEVQGTERRVDLPRPIKPGTRAADIYLRYDESGESTAETTLITAPAANHYRLMVEHFADAALNGTPLRYPPEEGRANMRVLDAIQDSMRTGRSVSLQ